MPNTCVISHFYQSVKWVREDNTGISSAEVFSLANRKLRLIIVDDEEAFYTMDDLKVMDAERVRTNLDKVNKSLEHCGKQK